MKKFSKRILGYLLIVLSVFVALNYHVVFAADDDDEDAKAEEERKKQEECNRAKQVNFSSKYGLSIDYDADNAEFIVKMNKPNEISWWKTDYSFKITRIVITDIVSENNNPNPWDFFNGNNNKYNVYFDSDKDTPGNEFKQKFGFSNNNIIKNGDDKGVRFKNIDASHPRRFWVALQPAGWNDPTLKDKCGDALISFASLMYDAFGQPIRHTDAGMTAPEPMADSSGKIDCSKEQTDEFAKAFCADMKAAKDSGAKVVEYTTEKNTHSKMFSTPEKYQCDAFEPIKNTSATNYYANRKYLLGTIEYTITSTGDGGQYIYHYGGHYVDKDGNWVFNPELTQKVDVSCKVTCDEVVTVEYGAPVASKAGLCFEYKVKVTSRVNCHVTQKPNPPITDAKYCTPSPGCNHGSGYVDKGAGPSEDFDACIDECDGGKYTGACSRKCYKKVYGSGKTASRTNSEFNFLYAIDQVYANDTEDRLKTCDYNGEYYTTGKPGKDWNSVYIIWQSYKKDSSGNWLRNEDGSRVKCGGLGRWYQEAGYTSGFLCVKTDKQGGGINSVCGCSARCRWNGCRSYKNGIYTIDSYLNPEEAKKDYEYNVGVFESVKKQCEAYSRCTTSKAEFSINVDYSYENANGKVVTEKIYFPYEKNNSTTKDTIQYVPETKTVSCTTKNSNSTILGSNGCYKCADGNSTNGSTGSNNWYQTEWSFPGTWIHKKTGEVSYQPKEGKSWTAYNDKFCVPLDALNVNQKWWNAYYIEKYSNNSSFSFNDSEYLSKADGCVIDNCMSYSEGSFTQDDAKKLTYNIHAQARTFGLFGWNIDVECFYALNNSFPFYDLTNKSCTTKNNCTPKPNSKRIRSVDLNDLFPDESGTVLSSPSTTGRSPGFNWSVYATNTEKDPNYTSRPSNYTTWVQQKGYNVYSDNYLDYDITLTKEMINQLKTQDRKYSQFDGDSITGSVINYRSSLFRGSNPILRSYSKVPDESVLKCNNIKNYQSKECEEFKKDGE